MIHEPNSQFRKFKNVDYYPKEFEFMKLFSAIDYSWIPEVPLGNPEFVNLLTEFVKKNLKADKFC